MKQASGQGIHDELTKTYFRVPQKKHENKKDKNWSRFLPWIIMAAVIAAALAIVLSRSSIDVKVRLLGEVPSFKVAGRQGAAEKGDFLIKGSDPQKGIVKKAYFSGDGKQYSVSRQDDLMFCNARGSGWANFTMELKEPVDLSRLDVKYAAKGARGGECLVLVIVDSSNRI